MFMAKKEHRSEIPSLGHMPLACWTATWLVHLLQCVNRILGKITAEASWCIHGQAGWFWRFNCLLVLELLNVMNPWRNVLVPWLTRLMKQATPKQRMDKYIEGYKILRDTDIPELKVTEDFCKVNLGIYQWMPFSDFIIFTVASTMLSCCAHYIFRTASLDCWKAFHQLYR